MVAPNTRALICAGLAVCSFLVVAAAQAQDVSFHNVSVMLGIGDGTFQAPRSFGAGLSPSSVAVGDFNDDGRLDLVAANGSSNDVTVLINSTGPGEKPLR